MKPKRRIGTLLLVFAVITTPEVADAAWPGGGLGKHRGKFWKRDKVRRELNLTDAEVRTFESIFARHQETLIEREAKVKQRKEKLDDLLADDRAEDEQVMAEVDALEEARAELGKARVAMLLEIRRALTAEQRDKLARLDEDDDDD